METGTISSYFHMNNWKTYQENTKDSPHHPLLEEALQYVRDKDSAFDFGAGGLRDSRFLLGEFERVWALDSTWEVQVYDPRFLFTVDTFENFDYPVQMFDLVNAQFSLPFVAKAEFKRVFQALKDSLKKGGILTGNLFGVRDEWVEKPGVLTHLKYEVQELLQGLEILELREIEYDGTTAAGSVKHWHVFEFIARKV